jgi:hypothetical protein
METVTIAAGCRIRVSVDSGFSVDAFGIPIIRMTGRTGLNHTGLIPFPGREVVNLLVAIFALNFIDEMGARVVFQRFFFMATMAGYGLGVDLGLFFLDVILDVGDVPVAAVTGVCPVNRLGKLSLVDLFSMTTQTF